MRLAFDLETDGLNRDLSIVHCLVAQDMDSGEIFRYDDSGKYESVTTGIEMLMEADELWGHNIIGYDYEAIKYLYPFFEFKGTTYDTLILSRLLFTDLLDRDFRAKPANMPGNLYGRHSLESWGHRLGIHKSDFGKNLKGDWSQYSPEMLDYCVQDVAVSVQLAKMFEPKLEQYKTCVETEHEVAKMMSWQERVGWPFDIDKAQKLEGKLRQELEALSDDMRSTFAFVAGKEFTPQRPNKTRGYFEGATFTRLTEFNPTSRQHIAWAFKTFRGWEPTEFTNTGIPKIDEKVLVEMDTEESKKFARILELQKHLGQLSEGANAWLKKVESDGRIHHSCVLNTNTGRMAHMKPNLAQTPSAHEYRELFIPGDNRVQIGADASSLELRCLAHYLAPFDGGSFAKEVVEGDIHTQLAEIYGTSRSTGKSVTYCLIYGGGNSKLGTTAGATSSGAVAEGKRIRSRILEGLAGFAELSKAIAERSKHGVLLGLDGRPIRLQGKNHAALNYLLQSAGAIICKQWLLTSYKAMIAANLDWYPLGFIHDELQISIRLRYAEQAEFILTTSMLDVADQLRFRCPLAAESKRGSSWADTH